MSPTLLDPSCSRLLKPSLVFGIFSYEIICIIITQSCHVKIRSLYLENVAVSWLKYFLVSSNDQVRCNCWTNPSCSSKESYLSRCPCLKLKRSCSKSCRCRYCVNGKWRETDPFKDKLNSCRCRSRGKSESLSACSNTFGKYKSRCPCLKVKELVLQTALVLDVIILMGYVSWPKSRTVRKFHAQKGRIKSILEKELQSILKCKEKSFCTVRGLLGRQCCFIA